MMLHIYPYYKPLFMIAPDSYNYNEQQYIVIDMISHHTL